MANLNMYAKRCSVDGCDEPWYKREWCSRHYRAWRTYGDPRFVARPDNNGRCSVLGCERLPRSRTSPHCEVHYYRLRRNGTLDNLPPRQAQTRTHTHGYILVPARGHRVATRTFAYEHRKVFFDAHGEGPFNCHVCGCIVTWSDMHVDHLNDIKNDNRIENLAAACERCNPWRGKDRKAMMGKSAKAHWIEHNGDRLLLTDWARRVDITPQALSHRIAKGWPLDRALSVPRGKFGPPRKAQQA